MFIVITGLDGCGKSTQITLLERALRDLGLPVVLTREPGGTPIGEQIRAALLNPLNTGMTAETEVLLYSAARAQVVRTIILPFLADGWVVLTSRYYESTLVYQGWGRGVDLHNLITITKFATAGLEPSLVVYLDISAREGLNRKAEADKKERWATHLDRLELEKVEFHQRVRQGYLALVDQNTETWMSVDATLPEEQIHQIILARVVELLDTE